MDTALTRTKQWLKTHGRAEQSFGRALRRYFEQQAERVASNAELYEALQPSHAEALLSPHLEHRRLIPIVRRNLTSLMAMGAREELDAFDDSTKDLSIDADDADYMGLGLDTSDILQMHLEAIPPNIRAKIREAVDATSKQKYWAAIQDGTKADIRKIIQDGLSEGVSGSTMASRIRDGLKETGRKRAMTIARTETTSALNAGHDASLQGIAESGVPVRKQWLSIDDDRTRTDHLQLNGETVLPKGEFNVGGTFAPFPSHPSLPASQRVNCRCVVIGNFD